MGGDAKRILSPVKLSPSMNAKGPLKENAMVIFLMHQNAQVEEFFFQRQVLLGFPMM